MITILFIAVVTAIWLYAAKYFKMPTFVAVLLFPVFLLACTVAGLFIVAVVIPAIATIFVIVTDLDALMSDSSPAPPPLDIHSLARDESFEIADYRLTFPRAMLVDDRPGSHDAPRNPDGSTKVALLRVNIWGISYHDDGILPPEICPLLKHAWSRAACNARFAGDYSFSKFPTFTLIDAKRVQVVKDTSWTGYDDWSVGRLFERLNSVSPLPANRVVILCDPDVKRFCAAAFEPKPSLVAAWPVWTFNSPKWKEEVEAIANKNAARLKLLAEKGFGPEEDGSFFVRPPAALEK